MASKDKKLVQENVKVANHGDMKIEEAKGKQQSNLNHSTNRARDTSVRD